MNLRLFSDPVFTSGTLVSASVMAVMMSGMFLLPLFMQEMLGFTAMQSGTALMPRTLVMVVVMPVVGRFYQRFHPAVLGFVGLLFSAYGQYRLSTMTLDSNASHVMIGIMLQGVGMALILVPINTVVLSNVPRHRLADATGLSSLLRQIGGSMGLAMFATRLSGVGVIAREAMKAHVVEQRPEVLQRLLAATAGGLARGLDPEAARHLAIASLAGTVARQGMVVAFQQMFVTGALLFALVAPLFLFVKRAKPAAPLPGSHPPGPAAPPPHVEIEV